MQINRWLYFMNLPSGNSLATNNIFPQLSETLRSRLLDHKGNEIGKDFTNTDSEFL